MLERRRGLLRAGKGASGSSGFAERGPRKPPSQSRSRLTSASPPASTGASKFSIQEAVLLAELNDKDFKQVVQVKVVKDEKARMAEARRFQREERAFEM